VTPRMSASSYAPILVWMIECPSRNAHFSASNWHWLGSRGRDADRGGRLVAWTDEKLVLGSSSMTFMVADMGGLILVMNEEF